MFPYIQIPNRIKQKQELFKYTKLLQVHFSETSLQINTLQRSGSLILTVSDIKNSSMTIMSILRSLIKSKKVCLEEDKEMYSLGKTCLQCQQTIIHRQCISVCSCYVFAHKECLSKLLKESKGLSECSTIHCSKCQDKINVDFDSDYFFEPKVTLKDLLYMGVSLLVLALMVLFLVKYVQSESQHSQEPMSANSQSKEHHKGTHQRRNAIGAVDVVLIFLVVISGFWFWMASLALCFKRRLTITHIKNTNQEIRVSAFEGIEEQIREESQQEILVAARNSNDKDI